MLISDSGNESILKSLLASTGLSGIIFFAHEMKIRGSAKQTSKRNLAAGFDIVYQNKRFRAKERENEGKISKILLLILNGDKGFL